MEIIPFFDRKEELKEIRDKINSDKFEFLIIYGRRRIGKTYLLFKVMSMFKNKKIFYYFSSDTNNIQRIRNLASSDFPEINNYVLEWSIIINELFKRYDIIILDEFQEIIKDDINILNYLQELIDIKLQNSKKKLIITGSLLSILKCKVLSYKSPLYGRKTYSLNLKEMHFKDIMDFFPNKKIEELVQIYGFAGGVPYYLENIDKNKKFTIYLNDDLNKKGSFIYNEMDFLLKYEFKEPRNYKLILEAIAHGKNTINEIKNYTGMSKTDITPYIRNLIEIDIVERVVPVTETDRSKKGIYVIKDKFTMFWFRFIYPNMSKIEQRSYKIECEEYNAYIGRIFENVALQLTIDLKLLNFTKIGRWWHKDKEIDIVAINENTKELLALEVKWKNINIKEAKEIIKELEEKTKYVQWFNDERKQKLGIFARKINKKAKEWLKENNYMAFDLKDVEKELKTKQNR